MPWRWTSISLLAVGLKITGCQTITFTPHGATTFNGVNNIKINGKKEENASEAETADGCR